MKYFYFLLIILLLHSDPFFAQRDSSTVITENFAEDMLESGYETENSELMDLIEDLSRNPLDINYADLFELMKLPGMDLSTARMILDHRNKFGPFASVYEVFSVKGISSAFIENMLPFISVEAFGEEYLRAGEDYVSDTFLHKSALSLRSRLTSDLQDREGFYSGKFQGSGLRLYNRLLYSYDKTYQLAFLTEKDPGEKSIADFTSFHLQAKELGILSNLVIGDYLLEFGQGLALWSPFGFSKGADAIYPVKKKTRYIRPYTSSLEYRFFRGIASTLGFNGFSLTAFYSLNTFDASIDSLTGRITSVIQTGYHRSESEIIKKNSARSRISGIVADYVHKDIFYAGTCYYNAGFDKEFEGDGLYDIKGKNFNYFSVFYDANFSDLNIFGEFAYDGTSTASLNGLQIFSSRDFAFLTALRIYPRNYTNLYGFGFSERFGRMNNEIGLYSGFRWRTTLGLLNVYYDIFRFPYRTDENPLSSEGSEMLLDFSSVISPKSELRLRYKYENKETTGSINSEEIILKRLKQTVRTEINYEVLNTLQLKTRFEYTHIFMKSTNDKEDGFLIFQEVKFLTFKDLILYTRFIFFQTGSFNSAVYEFENDLAGVMPNLALFGQGIRWYLLIRYRATDYLSISAKYSETYKPGETSLGTGNSRINGNLDNRFSMQIDLRL